MELRQYWNVIWKRKWLVLAIIVLAGILSSVLFLTTKKYYQGRVMFITRQEPTPDTAQQQYFIFDRYYNWFGSEFLVDDYTNITQSDAFANSVLQTMHSANFSQQIIDDLNQKYILSTEPGQPLAQLGKQDLDDLNKAIDKLKVSDIKSNITSDRKHRELALTVKGSTGPLMKAIADAAAIVLTDAKLKPIKGEMVDDKAIFSQIDEIGPETMESNRNKELINAVIRVIMGIVAALALAFLLEYLDRSVRDEQDVKRVLDLPVLGAIPRA
ncbi:MAG: Wzz/FepE/Etk N-terminal domain-containing protein [Chloroflexota bacterium]